MMHNFPGEYNLKKVLGLKDFFKAFRSFQVLHLQVTKPTNIRLNTSEICSALFYVGRLVCTLKMEDLETSGRLAFIKSFN